MQNFGDINFLHDLLLNKSQNENKLAIISKDQEWTYSDLRNYSLKYYNQLKNLRIPVGERVILELEPCAQAIALIIACSMLGLPFIPVSPEVPLERLQTIVDQTDPIIHIQSKEFQRNLSYKNTTKIIVSFNDLVFDETPINFTDFTTKLIEQDLAYIIFTSGSTGSPKGIMMSHRAVISFFKGLFSTFQIEEKARVGSISPLQFDFSLLDAGLALGYGSTLVLVPKILTNFPKRFVDFLLIHKITQMNGVPSIWNTTCKDGIKELERLLHLEAIWYGGESFPINNIRILKKYVPNLSKIINCFGHSESIGCSFYELADSDMEKQEIPIGFAHPFVEILLVDENNQIVKETGEIGELYLRGNSLFSGYWKDEHLTNRALLINPFRPWTRELIFKTGDLAQVGEDNKLYYKGRKDNQIKINGNRIEVEEIENILMAHKLVNLAVVIAVHSNTKDKDILVAILDLKENLPTNELEYQLRIHCGRYLPPYMMPNKFEIAHEKFGFTINQKTDRLKVKRDYLAQRSVFKM
ncbi:AMP-binding protein [Paenibacillus humicus]|uniref:AMP-binding protein n=1 Tax=Paenibacillus humicus TaxID=412861 RepID=UPI003D2C1B23